MHSAGGRSSSLLVRGHTHCTMSWLRAATRGGRAPPEIAALSFTLNPSHMRVLETASDVTPITPYWHQRGFVERNPFPT